ncbi:(2Fe-2S) ferredoxin domain-containing protein [Kosmotoga pacifica]|uniref:NADH dehydrogenase n=1 Tax=Kosmotoga pacifica TaxID=1330330 RepID=A0A0G2ZB63_9BACT|nr:(2Fe-2S) ferredoxin domain-containing protein [Kosmotoga pacifica]AKI97326.1 hypothetical protein IX53_05275 [Kosmotoga pacifica]
MVVKVCCQEGSCCFEKGSEAVKVIKNKFPKLDVIESGCLGVCKAVVAEVDGELYSNLNTKELIQLIESKM